MSLFHNSRNIPQVKTFEEIRECLRETNKAGKKEALWDFMQRKGKRARLGLYLFRHPNAFYIILGVLASVFFAITIILVGLDLAKFFWVRMFVLFLFVLYLLIPIFLNIVTPEFTMEFDALWSRVVDTYQDKLLLNDNQVKHNIKRTFLYYSRQSKPLRFVIKLIGGGIFIGCLPDPVFQDAIIKFFIEEMSVPNLFCSNKFGTVCLILLPFVHLYYYTLYKIPIVSMENIITQIELREITTGSIKSQPFWETATPKERATHWRQWGRNPEERATRWQQWVQSHKGESSLPKEALRRENIYD